MNKFIKKFNLVCYLLISCFLLSSCQNNIDYKSILKDNKTIYGTITVDKYQTMPMFIRDIGLKYDGLVTIRDYYYYLGYKATMSEAELDTLYNSISEDLGVQWTEDWTIIDSYTEGPLKYQYYYGTYKGQPVVYKWTADTDLFNLKENAFSLKITGNISKSYIKLYFVGLYNSGSADDFINQPQFLPCLLIEADKMESIK